MPQQAPSAPAHTKCPGHKNLHMLPPAREQHGATLKPVVGCAQRYTATHGNGFERRNPMRSIPKTATTIVAVPFRLLARFFRLVRLSDGGNEFLKTWRVYTVFAEKPRPPMDVMQTVVNNGSMDTRSRVRYVFSGKRIFFGVNRAAAELQDVQTGI